MAYKMAYLQDEDECSYLDGFEKVTSQISRMCKEVLALVGETSDEEAEICLAVLMGYSVTIRNDKNIRRALDRAFRVLPFVPDSFVKCQLLVYCYAETYEKKLSDEAEKMMQQWAESELADEVKHLQEFLEDLKSKSLMYEQVLDVISV